MRMYEIATAEEQLTLWKLISDNVWRAIEQQTSEQRKQQAAKAQQRKLKPKRGGKRGGRKSLPPPPPIKTPPPIAAAPTPTLNPQKNSGGTSPQAVGTINPLARNLLPTPSATQPLKPQQQQRL